ncbi:MAG: chemotaxis protein CheW [Coriobacteriia bacterium]
MAPHDPTSKQETPPVPPADVQAEPVPATEADVSDVVPAERIIDRAVAFRLAGQLYGLPIDVVQEIQQLAELLPLPDDDPALVGLIELRGAVVPVLDLRALVGLEEAPYTLETPMVFCHVSGHQVCLIVDSVDDVVDLPPASLQKPSALYTLADRMLGTVKLDQGVLMLLDIDRLVPAAALAVAEAQAVFDR